MIDDYEDEFPEDSRPNPHEEHICEDCGKVAKSKAGLGAHRFSAHGIRSAEKPLKKDTKPRTPNKGSAGRGSWKSIEKDLETALDTVGVIVERIVPEAGEELRAQAGDIAQSLDIAAKKYKILRTPLRMFCELAVAGNVVAAVKPVVDKINLRRRDRMSVDAIEPYDPERGASPLG